MTNRNASETFPQPPSVEVIPGGHVDGTVCCPGSKSLTNRALLIAALASGESTLTGALRSEDTEVMIDALRTLGVDIDSSDDGRTLRIAPPSEWEHSKSSDLIELYVANSGTTIRFLTAALSAAGGNYRLHGIDRMHERPIGDLTDALAPVVDGEVRATSKGQCPPVKINTDGWLGDTIRVSGSVSSQYLSGLMMAAPIALGHLAQSGSVEAPATRVVIEVDGQLVSRPYVEMTASVMRSFGAEVELSDNDNRTSVAITGEGYQGCDYRIEPDASAASYFWASAAVAGGSVRVQGLSRTSLQGDVEFCAALEQMGCQVEYEADSICVQGGALKGIDIEMSSISDTVQTLAVVALFADGPTRIRGVGHIRFKETDRIGFLAAELRKVGATIDEHDDGLTIHPPEDFCEATLETYNDHRMAMSFALLGLRVAGVKILDPACTAKTYPEFF